MDNRSMITMPAPHHSTFMFYKQISAKFSCLNFKTVGSVAG